MRPIIGDETFEEQRVILEGTLAEASIPRLTQSYQTRPRRQRSQSVRTYSQTGKATAKFRGERMAFGRPGIEPRWNHAAKEGVGTAYASSSRIWFTLWNGIITETYYPTIDRPQLRDLLYLITDGKDFFHEEKRHLKSLTERPWRHALAYRVTNSDPKGRYQIQKEIVAEVARGDEVVSAAVQTQPDVTLLDIEMPGGDGLNAAQALHERLPSCRVVILTTFGRSGYLRQAMESGAVGFLLKDAPAAELGLAIRRVMAGERVVDPELALAALSDGDNPLTPREREVLAAALDGASIADIAIRLVLSEGTVRNHLSTAIQKLGVHNRVEAARLAEAKGWL